MDRQYKPIRMKINSLPVIIYVAKDEVPVAGILPTQNDVKRYVQSVYTKDSHIGHGQYHIAFVWNKDGVPMLDVWVHDINEHSDSGPLLECYTFRDDIMLSSGDIASGDTIIALAAEEQKRRAIGGLQKYLDSTAPAKFPDAMTPKQEYTL